MLKKSHEFFGEMLDGIFHSMITFDSKQALVQADIEIFRMQWLHAKCQFMERKEWVWERERDRER